MSEQRRQTLWLWVFAVLPGLMFIAFKVAGSVPDRWRNLYGLSAFLAFLSVIVGVPVIESLRAERRTGLVPKRKGFEGKLELGAEKLREHAAVLEEDGSGGIGPVLRSYIRELQRVARTQRNHELLRGFDLEVDEGGEKRIRDVRRAAEELDSYAQQLRAVGGMFRLSAYEMFMGWLVTVAMFVWGVWLMGKTVWTPSLAFAGGATLTTFAVLFAFALWNLPRER